MAKSRRNGSSPKEDTAPQKAYLRQYAFQLTGISPLLMHWDNIEWADQLEEKRTQLKAAKTGKFKAGDDRCPPDTWKGYAYNDGMHLAIPCDNLLSGLKKAGTRVILSKNKTFKELTQCAILFGDINARFECNGQQIALADVEAIAGTFTEQASAVDELGFTLLVKRAAVGQTKHIRVRPRFNNWSCSGEFTIINEALTPEKLEEIWTIFGTYIGLCDWRPGSPKSPGPFGRFTATIKEI